MSDFLGITRERVYSPGRVSDDDAILRDVARHLSEHGYRVDVFDPDGEAWPQPSAHTIVFAMCQGPQAIDRLSQWERDGIRVINRPEGILNCQRHRTIPLLANASVGLPCSVLQDTGDFASVPSWIDESGAWVKRGDVHATEPDDVVRAVGAGSVESILRRFRDRGIRTAVIQQHAQGTVVKFYAVRGSFFFCVPPSDTSLPASVQERIDALGQIAAHQLGVEVYGGDCVYGKNGELALIDLNDWPSYRSCRASAAEAIADYLRAQKDSRQ